MLFVFHRGKKVIQVCNEMRDLCEEKKKCESLSGCSWVRNSLCVCVEETVAMVSWMTSSSLHRGSCVLYLMTSSRSSCYKPLRTHVTHSENPWHSCKPREKNLSHVIAVNPPEFRSQRFLKLCSEPAVKSQISTWTQTQNSIDKVFSITMSQNDNMGIEKNHILFYLSLTV